MGTGKGARPVGPVGKRVAANVRRYRQQGQMSLRDLSARLLEHGQPINASGIHKVEREQRHVDADELVALAKALDVLPETLLGGEGNPTGLSFDRLIELGLTRSFQQLVPVLNAIVAEDVLRDEVIAFVTIFYEYLSKQGAESTGDPSDAPGTQKGS
jgi:transcriptional regulator with XRE-family HTH domain